MDPIPDDLRPFYAGGYQKIPTNIDELRKIAQPEAYRMDPILKLKQGGRLLEIGPWMGLFSYNAKAAGFDVTAIEIDQPCVDFLNNTLHIRAIQSYDPTSTLQAMQEEFDVIALWHCLEHLRDPWVVIQRAAECLAPGGILLIAIPNIDSYEFSLLHAGWRGLDAPRHIYFFPMHSLATICEKANLVQRYATTNDQLSSLISEETWLITATDMVPIPYARGLVRRLFKSLSNRVELKTNSGPGITVIFQRPS